MYYVFPGSQPFVFSLDMGIRLRTFLHSISPPRCNSIFIKFISPWPLSNLGLSLYEITLRQSSLCVHDNGSVYCFWLSSFISRISSMPTEVLFLSSFTHFLYLIISLRETGTRENNRIIELRRRGILPKNNDL